MKKADLLFEALYYALIEIRDQGQESGNKVVFHLANLFHNVPSQLAQEARDECTYDDILLNLEEKADEIGCRAWLDNVYRQKEETSDV